MIARIKGLLAQKSTNYLIVDVNGIGYRVFVPLSTYYALPPIDKTVQLLVTTIVREDVFNLFGFLTQKEQDIFKMLISVSKIGPKLGLNILSGMSADSLRKAIILGDVEKLNSIPGVGKKTAERIVLELKEKIEKIMPEAATIETESSLVKSEFKDALSALINLGYKKPNAETALKKAALALNGANQNNDALDVESLIKGTLKILSGI